MNTFRSKIAILAIFATLIVAFAPSPDASASVYSQDELSSAWHSTGVVWAVDLSGDVVYFGGNFAATNNPAGGGSGQGNNVAAMSRISGDLIHAFDVEADGLVRAIESDGSTVWIGGDFLTVNGVSSPYLAAVDAQTGELLTGFNAVPNKPVYTLENAGGRLWVGGTFWQINGMRNRRVASLDPTTGAPDPLFDADANGKVTDTKLSNDGSFLLVGGGYEEIGGAVHDKLAMLDPVTGDALPVTFPAYGKSIRSIAVSDDDTTVFSAEHTNNSIIAYDSTTGATLWSDQVYGDGQALAFHDGFVYFGFHDPFPEDGSMRMVRYSQWGSWDSTWRPTLDSRRGVLAIDANSDGLVAGGHFKNVNGSFRKGVAIWVNEGGSVINPDTVAPTSPTGFTSTKNNGSVVKLVWNDDSTDDRWLAGYRVYRDGVLMDEIAENAFNDWNPPASGSVTTYEVRALDSGGNEAIPVSVTLTIP